MASGGKNILLLIKYITSFSSALKWHRDIKLWGKMLVAEGPITGAPYRHKACGGGPEFLLQEILRLRVLWNDFVASERKRILIP